MKKSLNITAKREQRLHIDLNKVQTGKQAHHLPDLQSLRTPRTTTLADSTDLSNQSLFHKKGGFSLANSAIPGLRLSEAFQGNDSRVKSFTIEQIQPFTSGSQTTRVNFTEKKKLREKKIVLWENIAMIKSHFEKYPLSLRNNGIASKLDTVTVFKFLKALQESDEDFEGVIDTIVAALKSLIYINYDTIEYYLNEHISEADDGLKKLFLTFYQPNSTYHKVCAELMKVITFKNNDIKSLEEKFIAEIQRIEDKCAEKDVIIEELNQQLQSTVSDEAYKGSIQQIDEIKEYYQSIAIENEELKRKYQALEESHTLLRTQYNEEVKQTEKYEEKIRNLKNEKTILISQSEKAKDAVNETQNKVQGLKDVMDKILVRLALVKKDIVDLRQQNIVLENENRKLNIRAAQGFDALTPRPDYKRLQEEKNIDLDIYNESGKTQLASTSDVVNKLVDEIIDLQNKLKAKTINFNVKNANGPSRKQSNVDLTEASLKAKNKRGSSIHSLFKTNLQRNNSDNRGSFINQQEPNETKSTDNHQQSDKSSTNEQNSEQLDPDFGVTKPAKSKFATSKFKIEISHNLNKNEFGVETIEKAQSVMKDVIEIKNTLKNLF